MVSVTLERELHKQLEQLSLSHQRQVLDFARALATARPQGVPGARLLAFGGAIEADDLNAMAQAIAEDCEQINHNDW
jgi:hypothetical protein